MISNNSDESSDDEIAFMTQGFKRFLKHNKKKTWEVLGETEKMFDGGDIQNVRFFHCDEKGHLKANCPQLKNEKGKGKEHEKSKHSYKHGMRSTWDHSEDEISSSDDEMATPICFMAHGNAAKVKPLPVYSDDMRIDEDMFEDIDEAYAFMLDFN